MGSIDMGAETNCFTPEEAAKLCSNYAPPANLPEVQICAGYWFSKECTGDNGKFNMHFNTKFNPVKVTSGQCYPPLLSSVELGPGDTPSAQQPIYHFVPAHAEDGSAGSTDTESMDVDQAKLRCSNEGDKCGNFQYPCTGNGCFAKPNLALTLSMTFSAQKGLENLDKNP